MYDVSALAVSTPQISSAPSRRAGAADDQDRGNFGDLIDRAGRNGSGRGGRDQDEPAADAEDAGKVTHKGREPDGATHQDSRIAKGHVPSFNAGGEDLNLFDGLGTSVDDVSEMADAQATPADNQNPDRRFRIAQLHHKAGKADQAASNAQADKQVSSQDTDAKLLNKQEKDIENGAKADEKRSAFEELNALLGVENRTQPDTITEAEEDKHPHTSGKRVSAKEPKSEDGKVDETSATHDRQSDKINVTNTAHHEPVLASAVANELIGDNSPETSTADDALAAITPERPEQPVRLAATVRNGVDKTDSDHEAGPAAGKTDFVAVLDSRRYLGLANENGNVSRLADAIHGDQTWVGRLSGADALSGNTATEVNTLKLQLNPEHLGSMTASLRLKGEELSVELRVDTIEAYRQLSGDQDSIVKALKDQGFSIDQVSVQLNPSAKSDSGQSGDQYPSDSGSQAQQGGGQGEGARQRDDSTRRNSNQNNWTANDASSVPVEAPADRTAAASGNLYL